MDPAILEKLREYADRRIGDFHRQRRQLLNELCLDEVLPVSFCLFSAQSTIKPVVKLIDEFLASYLSQYEEELFGAFLRDLAVCTVETTCIGHRSTEPGVDLELVSNGIHYIISIKSGPNWGNSSQQDKLEEDLKNAVARVKQSKRGANVQPVLGICYGKTRTGYLRGYLKVVGQNFWYLISGNRDLYTDIIEPIGYRAKEHNDTFVAEKGKVMNRFTKQFIERFCDESGMIDWRRLIEFNSGNFDLDKFLP